MVDDMTDKKTGERANRQNDRNKKEHDDAGSRYSLFCRLIDELDRGVFLIDEYDSQLHDYGGAVMFQAESQMVKAIGNEPGATAAHLAKMFGKTNSACSQIIRKLKKKQWVVQKRNENNSREYNLYLTPEGEEIYRKHHNFEDMCYKRTFQMLKGISDREMEGYIEIQRRLNKAFEMDVRESRRIFK